MKKIICILLFITICLSFTACSSKIDNTNGINGPGAIVVNNNGETENLTANELRTIYSGNQVAFNKKYFGAFVTLVADVVSVHGLTVLDGHEMVAYVVLEDNWTVEVNDGNLVENLMPGDTVIATGHIFSAHFDIELYIVNGWETTIKPYDGSELTSPLLYQKPILETISAGAYHTVGLKEDGTVVAVGQNEEGQCNTRDWKNIISVSAGSFHTVGLREDGTVVAVGQNEEGQCNVGSWTDIVSVSAGGNDTYGLKSDGTIVCTGRSYYTNEDPREWKNIVTIYAGKWEFFAWDINGRLLIADIRSEDDYRNLLVGRTDIKAIDSGDAFILYQEANGSVVVTCPLGVDEDPSVWTIEESLCEVSNWTNIASIATGELHAVGLKVNGTVVAVYAGYRGDVSRWKNIVAISAGGFHTIGLRADGTVVATGFNGDGQCDVSAWKNIRTPNK